MSDLVKSKRQAAARGPQSPAAPSHQDGEDDTIPDVSATPKDTSSSAQTPKPASTEKQGKITMADIKLMMATTARDITTSLTAKHEAEMKIQLDAVKTIEKKFAELQQSTQSQTQASPFETPRAERPQDVAYKQILTTSKKEKVKDKATVEPQDKESLTDKTLQALVKMMDTTIKNTNSKETTTDLPKFTGKDTQWERWYELLRSYFQAKGWLETFDHPIGPGTPDNVTPPRVRQQHQRENLPEDTI